MLLQIDLACKTYNSFDKREPVSLSAYAIPNHIK